MRIGCHSDKILSNYRYAHSAKRLASQRDESFAASRYFEIRSSAPIGIKWTPWQRSLSPFTRALAISMLAFSLSGALANFSMIWLGTIPGLTCLLRKRPISADLTKI